MTSNIVLFGPPGSGKGTQARKITAKFGIPAISTGDLLREQISRQTHLGEKVKTLVNQGTLVPDDIIIEIIKKYIKETNAPKGYVFDGFPRTLKQAQDLDALLQSYKRDIKLVISLKVDDNELIDRILGRGKVLNRYDDQSQVIIQKRLNEYYTKTAQVEEFYRQQKKLVELDGSTDVNIIFQKIEEIIAKFDR